MSIENTHYGAEAIAKLLAGCEAIFFIGIGGISMSSLARLSRLAGYRVGGSDRGESDVTRGLQADGIPVCIGHNAANLCGYGAVVYTVAIGEENPEYREALHLGIPLLSRADYLGYLMTAFSARVGIAGMHGKSTCTAMCDAIFSQSADPTVLCGAPLPALGGATCRIGSSREQFVFEACEYMDSFLDFYPTLAVVLNMGMDHVDYFHDMEQIRASFLAYARRVGEKGSLLYNADDAESVKTFSSFTGRRTTFGIDAPADYSARSITSERSGVSFDLYAKEEHLCRVSLRLHGKHAVYNALAAAAAALLCGLSCEDVVKGLASFTGAGRRMEYKGELGGASVYDDYGHHPDEIRATLKGAREMGYQRILCAYQPHTFSRTAGLLEEFSQAFEDADLVYLADIYAARETNVLGVTSRTLADRIGEKACYCGDLLTLADAIKDAAQPKDLIIVMGAGDINKVFDLLWS